MSKSYTFAKTWGDKVLARGYDNGTPFLEKVPFGPTLFVQSNKQDESTWKSLYEQSPLEPVKFDSIKEAKAFVERYKDVEQFPIHGFQRWEYQWINENYPGKIQHDISDINILTLDIEVVSEDPNAGFPDIQLAETPIVLISYHSSKDKRTVVLGTKTYIQRPEDDFEYQQCDDERALLRKFIAFCQTNKPDAWTGWNTSHFDTPYLVNRIIKLFDLNMAKLLSPFGIITEKNIFVKGKSVQTYDVVGVIDLDYLELYKKFGTYSAKESYSLDFISGEELGREKVPLFRGSFTENYTGRFRMADDELSKYSNSPNKYHINAILRERIIRELDERGVIA